LHQQITFFNKYLSYLGTFRGPPEGASRPTGWESLVYVTTCFYSNFVWVARSSFELAGVAQNTDSIKRESDKEQYKDLSHW